jgi:hypothetical protein
VKDCGSCQDFIKFKNDQHSGGLCNLKDGRTNTDSGHTCEMWKGIPYNRVKMARLSAVCRPTSHVDDQTCGYGAFSQEQGPQGLF